MANGRGGPRLAKQWESLAAINISMTADSTNLGASSGTNTSQTVLRMIGEYVGLPSAATVAGDRAVVTVGIGVISSDAFAAGAGSVPDPAGESEYPWLYWASHPFRFGDTSVDPNSQSASVRHTYDIRSMRKMKPRESLALIVQYVDINGAPPIAFLFGATRVLIGLH